MNRIVLRLFRRHIGRFAFFATTIAVGIGFLFAIGNLLSTINGSIAGRARDLLTADVVIGSWRPMPEKVTKEVSKLENQGYKIGRVIGFPSMLRIKKGKKAPVLISVKGIDKPYPMYGELVVKPKDSRQRLHKENVALIGKELFEQHGLKVGDPIQIGALTLKVAGVIQQEPDQVITPGGLAPRVMVPIRLLKKTGLVRFGSRIRYNVLISLPKNVQSNPKEASKLKKLLAKKFNDPYIRITAYTESQPTLREVLRRTASFFLLASLVALLLGAIGMAASVTAFLNEQLTNVGILRCLGLGPSDVSRLYLRLCVGIGILGGLGGVLLGYGLSYGGTIVLGKALGVALTPGLDVSYLIEGMLLAIVLSVGLNYAAIRVLSQLSPQGILRGQIHRIAVSRVSFLITSGTVLVGLFLYTFKGSRSFLVATFFTSAMVGTILACLALIGIGLGVVSLLSRMFQGQSNLSFHIRHGLRQLLRQRTRTLTFLLALSIGLTLLGSLRMIQFGIVEEIRMGRAKDIPNLFLVDIQSDQLKGVKKLIKSHKGDKTSLSPLIRARLSHINGKIISNKDLKGMTMEARSRARFLTREYNLTYKDKLTKSETIVDGKFWEPGTTIPQASLEKRFAQRIGVGVGDKLTFDIVGRSLEITVTSIRTINWMSMMPNFFVVMPTSVLAPAPKIFIGSLHLKEKKMLVPFQRKLVKAYPNVNALQVAPIIERVTTLLRYFIGALQALAWVCIGVGLLILAGTLHMGRSERRNKVALMRTLGSRQNSILSIDVIEFLTIGALSGLIAIGVSYGLTYVMTSYMNVRLHLTPMLFIELGLAGLFLPLIVGTLTNRKVYNTGVMENLRHIGA